MDEKAVRWSFGFTVPAAATAVLYGVFGFAGSLGLIAGGGAVLPIALGLSAAVVSAKKTDDYATNAEQATKLSTHAMLVEHDIDSVLSFDEYLETAIIPNNLVREDAVIEQTIKKRKYGEEGVALVRSIDEFFNSR